jgi:hypothetical protein
VCSALAQLPVYTLQADPIDLKKDVCFSDAMKRAQHNARISERTQLSEALDISTYEQLCGYKRGSVPRITSPDVRLLLQLCWSAAGRVGDVRQLRPNDIQLGSKNSNGRHLTLTYRVGKGAAFWGPYTTHTIVREDIAKDLATWIRGADPAEALFPLHTQAQLAAALKATGNNLRSIRRGALLHDAARGVGDEDLCNCCPDTKGRTRFFAT